MIQIINDIPMFVVELETMPEEPLFGIGVLEQVYANALNDAVESKQLTEPGTYGIHLEDPLGVETKYTIYTIT